MKLSQSVAYAIHAVLRLASGGESAPVACGRLAADGKMPERFLLQILRNLVAHGILESTRGVEGGYTLDRAPEDISVLEVIEAIDGPIMLNECVGDTTTCTFDEQCPLRPVWCEAQNDLVAKLRGTTFEQMLEQSKAAALN